MRVQCINCKYAERPNKNCACNNKVKYPLIDVVPMKYNDAGDSYCDGFRPIYKGKK